ncbi:hypothetical protein ASF58_02145 [Methylobacterium sp. Leaf125]|jgi:hypothetical protein|uniref:hypothetical protein n=1 Tax=unclassified Methylobacterium TaxID=2615210 RepID=UPI0006FE807C|nr:MULTISPECIES: hypothetical protein [unclassified Methylobacterium]KQQ48158.1 hypothetical protein ASF58_02145 [Methylobacterium sp. Leaf125]POR44447.1 hypothetical protein CRT23_00195 [Methylobacterium sp. V23]
MARTETARDDLAGALPESDSLPRRDLVVISGGAAPGFRPIPARPLSGFLAQLIVSVEPTLRPSRLERTRSAAARYAEAARRA